MATAKKTRITRTRASAADTAPELEETLKAIRARFGSMTAVRASSIQQPERISTGSFMLDFATLGGIPHNRVSMFLGEKHSGKSTMADKCAGNAQRQYPDQKVVKVDIEGCVAWYERILDTASGLVYTAEQIYRRKLPIQVVSFDEGTGQLVTKPVTHWFDNGVKPVLRVSTKNTQGDFTDNHRFLVYAGAGEHVWLRADELEPGMWVCRPRALAWKWPDTPSRVGDSRLVGYLLGDGHFGDNGVGFTNIDPDAIADVRALCAAHDVGLQKVDDRHYRISLRLTGAPYGKYDENPIRAMLREAKLYGRTGADKFIPSFVMNGTHDDVAACLTGLYMADGTVHPSRPTLGLSTISQEMAEQVRHLWSRYGVVARLTKVTSRSEAHSQLYAVTINGISALRTAACILSLVGYKQAALQAWVASSPGRGGQHPLGAFLPDLYLLPPQHRKRQRAGMRNPTGLYWEQVESIESAGEVQTYDFTVADTHNLVVNDMVVHNTHDSLWAEKNGVDVDELILAQPETGESAADMVDALVRTKEVSLVIVDSIAALTPMKEIESSAEDALVGVQARLVGGLVRKVTAGLIAERNRGHLVTVILVNQFRSKIGGFAGYGEPRSIPGGKALEYSTSLQVIFKNREMAGKDAYDIETVSVNEHSFDIKKNKLNSGPRQGEFRMLRVPNDELGLSEAEIDDASTMLAYAKKFGIYAGGGSSWKLVFGEDEHKFRGAGDAIAALYADRDFYWRLRNILIRTQAEHLGMPESFLSRFD